MHQRLSELEAQGFRTLATNPGSLAGSNADRAQGRDAVLMLQRASQSPRALILSASERLGKF